MNRFRRASREVIRHPDEGKQTQRIPFSQLRALVLALIQKADPPEIVPLGRDDDWEREFEAQPTTYRPPRLPPPPPPKPKRATTLDEVIASLAREPVRS